MSNTTTQEEDYTTLGAYKAGVLIWKIVPPILIVLGSLGNCLSIYVLTRRSIRTSTTALFLTVLAFSDLVVLYSGLLRQWLIYLFEKDVRHVSQAGCKINIWLVYSSLDFSAWILIIVTLERVIAAWFPHKAKTVCTKTSAIAFMVAILVFILTLNSHLLYGLVFKDVYDANGNTVDVTKCVEIDEEYIYFFNVTWPWIDLCSFCVIPFCVIVAGNSLIVFKVLQSQKRSKATVVPSTTGTTKHRGMHITKQSSMTAMLFTLNIVFLVSTSPVSIYNIGYTHWATGASASQWATLDLWWAIVNMFMYTNNSLNFLLYCLSGSKFRREVVLLFCSIMGSGEQDNNRAASAIGRTSALTNSRSQLTPSPINTANNSPNINGGRTCANVSSNQNGNGSRNQSPPKTNTLHPDTARIVAHSCNGDGDYKESSSV